MPRWIARYTRWLHTRWPAGSVEPLPEVAPDGSTRVPGLSISGDLTGIPLLKFALDTGARAVQGLSPSGDPGVLDLVILGAGVSGMAAAVEAKKRDLRFEILEAEEPFATLVNFPRQKPIYTYPRAMEPAGDLKVSADVKEALVAELVEQTEHAGIRPRKARAERVERGGESLVVHLEGGDPIRARRVLIAIGQSGDFRMLGVAGEDLDKVYNRLHDPKDFAGLDALVVGGGDSA